MQKLVMTRLVFLTLALQLPIVLTSVSQEYFLSYRLNIFFLGEIPSPNRMVILQDSHRVGKNIAR